MKAIGYIRVSTEEQAESGLSLAHQEAKIKAYAVAMDIDLVDVIEDAASAKNMNRPGIVRALDMIRRKEAEGIIILKLDRLTRSVKDLGIMVETFEKTGAALISVQDSINTTTAAGRLVLNVLASISQWEREAIGERTSAAMQIKRDRGELVGRIPFGFDLDTDGRTLKPNQGEQEAIALLRELRSEGLSFRKIGAELERRGIPTKNGGSWQAMTIRNICEAQQ